MRKLLLLGVVAAFGFAGPAYARNGAWYVGGDFGGMLVEDIDFDFGIPPVPPPSQISLNHDYGYDGALFVGYDLGAFRLEAEAAYKRVKPDEITIDPFPKDPAGGRTSALSFMVNGMLDFGDDNGLSGFVGVGAGAARIDYNNIRAIGFPAAIDDSDTRFAWQVVAGVRQAISEHIDVTLRYRFFNTDDVRTVNFAGVESDSRFRSHSLLGGITFNFGAPPQPLPQTH